MNKKVIKDNKEAFEHWLNGGELLAKRIDCIDSWHPFEHWNHNDWNIESDKVTIVINDEYVELRKALTEGKVIQEKSKNWSFSDQVWADSKLGIRAVDAYRIKPDEPTFKVGDWIQFSTTKLLLGKIAGFSSTNVPYCLSGRDKITPNTLELELWSPKPNEWCVFWRTDMTEYLVSTFKYRRDCGAYITDYGHEFYNIAPLEFINTLPEELVCN